MNVVGRGALGGRRRWLLGAAAGLAAGCGGARGQGAQPPTRVAPRTMESIPVRAYLLHLTHYDPEWDEKRWRDVPSDIGLALEIVDAMATARMNTLIVDIADGVEFATHPELKRAHTLPMAELRRIASLAKTRGIDVIPKLNFSKGDAFRHNAWMAPHDAREDDADYWRVAFELVDELRAELGDVRFFHIGMDEDSRRSPAAYVEAVRTLSDGLRARGLRPVMWNDAAQIAEKAVRWRAVQEDIPRDVIQVLWDYHDAQFEAVAHLRRRGFDVWGAPGTDHLAQVVEWRRELAALGGTGLVLTQWLPCTAPNRDVLLDAVRRVGALYFGTSQ